MDTQLVPIHPSGGFSRRTALCAAAGLAVSAIVGRAWTTEPNGIVPVEEIWRRIRRLRYGGTIRGIEWMSDEAAMRSMSLSATEGVGQGGNRVATAVQQAVSQYSRSFRNYHPASATIVAIGGRSWPPMKSTEWDIEWDVLTESLKPFEGKETITEAIMYVDDQQSREIVATVIVAR